jgi:hypothetical protein
MAHIYHGSTELILTSANKQSFDSGLNRVDCVFKCRTTTADDYVALLSAGEIMPGFEDYIIKDPATKQTGSDGFTTFTVSGFFGTLALSSGTASVPSVIGAITNNFTIAINSLGSSALAGATFINYILDINILSDTLVRTLTIAPSESITTLDIPEVNLSYVINYGAFSYLDGRPVNFTYDLSRTLKENINNLVQFFPRNDSSPQPLPVGANFIDGDTTISNVSRSNFGNVDEVTITYSQFFRVANEITILYVANP